MSKRQADKQLTHDNWDEEEEDETPGTFQPVSPKNLEGRIIKKAIRRITKVEESGAPNPFARFAGFSTTHSNPSSFSFPTKEISPKSSATSSISLEPKQNGSSVNTEDKVNVNEKDNVAPTSSALDMGSTIEHKGSALRDLEYYRQLKALNESVSQWILLHLSKSPYCDFTPVFKDYEKHMEKLDKKYPVKKEQIPQHPISNTSSTAFPFKVPSAPATSKSVDSSNTEGNVNSSSKTVSKMFKFGDNPAGTSQRSSLGLASSKMDYGSGFASNTTNTSTFSFGIKMTPTATVSGSPVGPTSSCSSDKTKGDDKDTADEKNKAPAFSFGFKNSNIESSSKVNVSQISNSSGDKPLRFAVAAPECTDSRKGNDDDEEYVPPKNEFTPVSESDALYTKRCKLFIKKEESYVERGIGTLYLKPLNGKTQLLIRADTSLGNILLNIMLSASLPTERAGKNNVLIVCVPNPPLDAAKSDSKEAIPVLIKVKTSEDADELLEKLKIHKTQN